MVPDVAQAPGLPRQDSSRPRPSVSEYKSRHECRPGRLTDRATNYFSNTQAADEVINSRSTGT